MKILFTANVSDLYGASRSLLRLTSRLVQDGHHVEVLLPDDGPLRARLREAGVHVLIHSGLPVLSGRALKTPLGACALLIRSVASALRIARHIRATGTELVHTNSGVLPSAGIAARLCGVPHVWHMREFFAGASRLWPIYQWFMFLCARRIVCISEAVAAQFALSIRRRKVAVVYNGIPAGELAPSPPEVAAAFRAKHGLSGSPLVGVVGRINLEQKGQDVFVQAAARLVPRFPGVTFLIAGDPYPGNEDHERRLRELVAAADLSDRVVFTRGVDNIPALNSALDICVLPARKPEGLGNVLLEAMAMSKPVVGSAIGGIPEIIEHGSNGFLVPPGDPAALAGALEPLLESADLRRRMGAEGRRRFGERFEFESCYRSVRELYGSLLGVTPPASQSASRKILGVRVNRTSYADATRRVLGWARNSESRYVAVACVNNIMEAHDSADFHRIMNDADLVTPDGMPLVWGLRLLGAHGATRVYGPDLTPALLTAAERERIPVGFYGGAPEAMERLFAVLRRRYPDLPVAYFHSPPFRPLSTAEDEGVIRQIAASGARILFVGLSTPKQERWMASHRGRIPAVMLGVGAAFDFLAGAKPQAPQWMRNTGLEWLFRLATEPRRLWRRYLKHNPRFAVLFALQLLTRKTAV